MGLGQCETQPCHMVQQLERRRRILGGGGRAQAKSGGKKEGAGQLKGVGAQDAFENITGSEGGWGIRGHSGCCRTTAILT